jgi:gas vesicle protein
MKRGKLITGITLGAIVALIVIPKTRKMLADAVDNITGSVKDMISGAGDLALKGKKEINQVADKAKDAASSVWNTKAAWNA